MRKLLIFVVLVVVIILSLPWLGAYLTQQQIKAWVNSPNNSGFKLQLSEQHISWRHSDYTITLQRQDKDSWPLLTTLYHAVNLPEYHTADLSLQLHIAHGPFLWPFFHHKNYDYFLSRGLVKFQLQFTKQRQQDDKTHTLSKMHLHGTLFLPFQGGYVFQAKLDDAVARLKQLSLIWHDNTLHIDQNMKTRLLVSQWHSKQFLFKLNQHVVRFNHLDISIRRHLLHLLNYWFLEKMQVKAHHVKWQLNQQTVNLWQLQYLLKQANADEQLSGRHVMRAYFDRRQQYPLIVDIRYHHFALPPLINILTKLRIGLPINLANINGVLQHNASVTIKHFIIKHPTYGQIQIQGHSQLPSRKGESENGGIASELDALFFIQNSDTELQAKFNQTMLNTLGNILRYYQLTNVDNKTLQQQCLAQHLLTHKAQTYQLQVTIKKALLTLNQKSLNWLDLYKKLRF